MTWHVWPRVSRTRTENGLGLDLDNDPNDVPLLMAAVDRDWGHRRGLVPYADAVCIAMLLRVIGMGISATSG